MACRRPTSLRWCRKRKWRNQRVVARGEQENRNVDIGKVDQPAERNGWVVGEAFSLKVRQDTIFAVGALQADRPGRTTRKPAPERGFHSAEVSSRELEHLQAFLAGERRAPRLEHPAADQPSGAELPISVKVEERHVVRANSERIG